MGKAKRIKRARMRQGPHRGIADALGTDIGPMTFEGRIITARVIAEMRASDPEHAHQLDAEWEAMVLENNAPWIDDPQLLQAEEAMWARFDSSCPLCQDHSGSGDHHHGR
ncbi:hypothetical protein ACFV0L_43630 [Streptosporangium canum]|uniref:hypothetical protein n=1 Tax=Streptosporangium canum TaxID=324952 RepID=UPI00369E711D